MTNSHDTTVYLSLLPAGMQPTYGSNDDIIMPQLLMPFSLVPSYQAIYLPPRHDALRAISASPGASQGLAGQLYCKLSVPIGCALWSMWEPCLCGGAPLEPVFEGSCVSSNSAGETGFFIYIFCPPCLTNHLYYMMLCSQCDWWFSITHWMHPRVFGKWPCFVWFSPEARILLLPVQSVGKSGRV
jgi:hypothetical protein